jgi:hypothetical protein
MRVMRPTHRPRISTSETLASIVPRVIGSNHHPRRLGTGNEQPVQHFAADGVDRHKLPEFR